MSTYAKAWIFNVIWTVFAVLGLVGLFQQWVDGQEAPVALLVGMAGYAGCIFLAGLFPKCSYCREPVNDAHIAGNGRIGYVVRPDRPPRECGYCGHALT